jgi:hypothetical protein
VRPISVERREPIAAAWGRGGKEREMAARLGAGLRSVAAIRRPCRGRGGAAPMKCGGRPPGLAAGDEGRAAAEVSRAPGATPAEPAPQAAARVWLRAGGSGAPGKPVPGGVRQKGEERREVRGSQGAGGPAPLGESGAGCGMARKCGRARGAEGGRGPRRGRKARPARPRRSRAARRPTG